MEEKEERKEGEAFRIESAAVDLLKTVYDPEIPVDIYNLGLIYRVEYDEAEKTLHVDMTLTAPSCPAADLLMYQGRQEKIFIVFTLTF